ncbi:unnamed protein product, partial [Vitrella brassicaformis CCMP3155]
GPTGARGCHCGSTTPGKQPPTRYGISRAIDQANVEIAIRKDGLIRPNMAVDERRAEAMGTSQATTCCRPSCNFTASFQSTDPPSPSHTAPPVRGSTMHTSTQQSTKTTGRIGSGMTIMEGTLVGVRSSKGGVDDAFSHVSNSIMASAEEHSPPRRQQHKPTATCYTIGPQMAGCHGLLPTRIRHPFPQQQVHLPYVPGQQQMQEGYGMQEGYHVGAADAAALYPRRPGYPSFPHPFARRPPEEGEEEGDVDVDTLDRVDVRRDLGDRALPIAASRSLPRTIIYLYPSVHPSKLPRFPPRLRSLLSREMVEQVEGEGEEMAPSQAGEEETKTPSAAESTQAAVADSSSQPSEALAKTPIGARTPILEKSLTPSASSDNLTIQATTATSGSPTRRTRPLGVVPIERPTTPSPSAKPMTADDEGESGNTLAVGCMGMVAEGGWSSRCHMRGRQWDWSTPAFIEPFAQHLRM